MKKLLLALLTTSFCISNVNAGILYEQQMVPNSTSGNATFTNVNTWGAEDFNLSDSSLIESLAFWGASRTTQASSADWRIYSDNTNLPGSIVSSGTVSGANFTRTIAFDDPNPGNPFDSYLYTLDIVDLVLNPGTYWIAFSPAPEPEGANPNGPHWLFADGNGNNLSALSVDNGSNWTTNYPSNDGNLAFQVNGSAVPLPAAIWLLGSGLLGLFSFKRKTY